MIQAAKSKGKIAWCFSPVLSGVTTVYQVVGEGLRKAGWQVLGVSAGSATACKADPRFADAHFEALATDSADVCAAAREFIRWVGERGIDLVFCSEQLFCLAAAPALPAHVRLITRSGSITRHSYELATVNLPRISRVVVETPRQQRDLIQIFAVPPEKLTVISGGVELKTFTPGRVRDFLGSLRLVYLGRLDDLSKGVLMLPQIARRLVESGIEFHLSIIGEGPDEGRLRKAFRQAKISDQVTFHGYMPREATLPILQGAHLFVLPSRYEGHSWALLETMACGCVPIASRIAGGTDFVVEQGVNGMLCTVGDARAFAKEIVSLSRDRKRMEILSAAASGTIRERFSLDRVVSDHDALFQMVLAQEPMAYTPIPASKIQAPKLSGAAWRRYVPQGVKNYARTWAERLHRTV